jgi:hypothetical protein
VHIEQRFDLEHAGDALQALRNSHTRGKLGIQVS